MGSATKRVVYKVDADGTVSTLPADRFSIVDYMQLDAKLPAVASLKRKLGALETNESSALSLGPGDLPDVVGIGQWGERKGRYFSFSSETGNLIELAGEERMGVDELIKSMGVAPKTRGGEKTRDEHLSSTLNAHLDFEKYRKMLHTANMGFFGQELNAKRGSVFAFFRGQTRELAANECDRFVKDVGPALLDAVVHHSVQHPRFQGGALEDGPTFKVAALNMMFGGGMRELPVSARIEGWKTVASLIGADFKTDTPSLEAFRERAEKALRGIGYKHRD